MGFTPRRDEATLDPPEPPRLTTYPPPPHMAAQMGVQGNPNCHYPTPMASMMCGEGHRLECHAGMTWSTARCSHLSRYHERSPLCPWPLIPTP